MINLREHAGVDGEERQPLALSLLTNSLAPQITIMRPRSAPASRRRGAYGHSKDGPPQSPHLLELPQEPARRGRHVDAVVRVRPRWPGRESANPSAYITSGCSIVPNPEARRQMLGARATSVGTPADATHRAPRSFCTHSLRNRSDADEADRVQRLIGYTMNGRLRTRSTSVQSNH